MSSLHFLHQLTEGRTAGERDRSISRHTAGERVLNGRTDVLHLNKQMDVGKIWCLAFQRNRVYVAFFR